MPKPQAMIEQMNDDGPNCKVEEVVGTHRKEVPGVVDPMFSGGQWGYITNRGEFQEYNSDMLHKKYNRGGDD